MARKMTVELQKNQQKNIGLEYGSKTVEKKKKDDALKKQGENYRETRQM